MFVSEFVSESCGCVWVSETVCVCVCERERETNHCRGRERARKAAWMAWSEEKLDQSGDFSIYVCQRL